MSEAEKGHENFSVVFQAVAEKVPNEVLLAVERPLPSLEAPGVAPPLPWGDWRKWTAAQYYKDACSAAKAYMVLGVERFGTVAVFGFNAPEWSISAMGSILCGAKYAGIYLTDTPEQIQYKISHSGSTVVVLDSDVEFDKVASKIDELPGVAAIAVWGMRAPADLKRADGSVCRVMHWDDLLALGEAKGLEYCRNMQPGGSGAKPFLHWLADKLILSKARQALGLHKCNLFMTGAAPMSLDTFEYFGQLGMNIYMGFGMSESSAGVTLCTRSANQFLSCGPALMGTELACFRAGPNGEKVEAKRSTPGKPLTEEEQGEICFRGRHVMMGYLANPQWGAEHVADIEKKTREAIDDEGWLHTGTRAPSVWTASSG
ncbi:unnamed protein product [Prorocentrum cordatum]|uniref:AMP-dependent synthetase/ligase domain-containing protein n=1 Tax=Prorocentrum cordatum TaxID=2364126 RepID=A0ABN9TWW9_9DINO|nr:unnamed protein product [Polarella glacialis]